MTELNLDIFWQGTFQQFHLLFQQRHQIERPPFEYRPSAEIQNLLDHICGAQGLLFDRLHPGSLAFLKSTGLRSHLCIDQDHGHDIVEVVGDTGRQLADGSKPLLALELQLHSPRFSHIAKYDHPTCRRCARVDGASDQPHKHFLQSESRAMNPLAVK